MMRGGMISVQVTHKIEGPTLTTHLENTMTTNIKVISTPDISMINEVIGAIYESEDSELVLSAASFLVSDVLKGALIGVLGFVYSLINKNMPDYNVWLFLGNSAWQPDTRIVRYRKLWGALKFRGNVVLGSDSYESVVEADGKLKFFGAVRLSELSIATVIDVIVDERCSYIVALPKNFEVQSALNIGWSGNLSEDFGLCCCVCEQKGLLIKQVGEFDDRERGFVSIGLPGRIEKLLN